MTSFLVISSFVILSMFIGAMTMAMEDEMQALATQRNEKMMERRRKEHATKARARDAAMLPAAGSDAATSKRDGLSLAEVGRRTMLRKLLISAFGVVEEEKASTDSMAAQLARSTWDVWMVRVVEPLHHLTNTNKFRNFITCVVIFSGLIVGVQTEKGIVDAVGLTSLKVSEGIVLGIFILEAAFKIAACGARPWDFLADRWNIFDALIIVGALASVGMNDSSSIGGLIRMMRLLRLFLVFKVRRDTFVTSAFIQP